MRHARQTAGRSGFTLIELTVVILIILILAGLIGAGVLKYMDLAPQLNTTKDIQQLTNACEAFKLKYKTYPPSNFLLSNNPAHYQGNPYGTVLFSIWPRINVANVNWGTGGADVVLEGDQCLVFFLQGMSALPGGGPATLGTGFSTDQTNPTRPAQNPQEVRNGPYFNFPLGRLMPIPHQSSGAGNPNFPSFADSYALPTKFNVYAFFSSGRTTNGYSSDCPSLGPPLTAAGPMTISPATAVYPYVQANNRFYNASGVQIISAGKDLTFGNVGAGNAFSFGQYPSGSYGFDDLANFGSTFLGVPNQ